MPESARARREEPFRPGRFYRVNETTFDGNWPVRSNYEKAKPYLADVPADEGYNEQVRGGRTIGQAGRFTYAPDLPDQVRRSAYEDSDLVHCRGIPRR
jgi:hypothetical protein